MSEGSELCGGTGRSVGRGAGRGTGEASAGELKGCGFGVSFSDSAFFFGVADLSASALGLFLLAGVSLALAFGFGVTSSSSSPDFLPGDFDAFGFGVDDASSLSPFAGVFFGFGFAVGVGVALVFVFVFRFAGFGFAVGSGVSDGVGEVTARISSRAFFFFSGSIDCAWTNAPRIAASVTTVPRKTRSRITGRERNRGGGAIKRVVGPLRAQWPRARVRDAKSHSVFRRATKAGRSDTSRSSAR